MDTSEVGTKISLGNYEAKPLPQNVRYIPWHSARASKVLEWYPWLVSACSGITRPRWLVFFDSELCSVRGGDEFGLALTLYYDSAEELERLAFLQ